jgi:hypothetical protein
MAVFYDYEGYHLMLRRQISLNFLELGNWRLSRSAIVKVQCQNCEGRSCLRTIRFTAEDGSEDIYI